MGLSVVKVEETVKNTKLKEDNNKGKKDFLREVVKKSYLDESKRSRFLQK